MKLYQGKYILPGLGAFLLLVTLPVWRGAIARGSNFQSPPNPNGERCIESKAFMRASHMQVLVRWRDDVVRENDRVYVATDGRHWEKSLTKTCLGCHGAVDAHGRSMSAATACDECHSYADVRPDCWNCHHNPSAVNANIVTGRLTQEARR